MPRMKTFGRATLLALTLLAAACSSSRHRDLSTAEGAFLNAQDFEEDERFEEAIQKYNDVKNKHPYSRFAAMAELKVADVHYKKEAWIEAQHAYQTFRELHPKHPQIDYVTFRVGMSFYNQLPSSIDRDLSPAEKAIEAFDDVKRNFTASTHIKEATEKRELALKMLAEKELYVADYYLKKEKFDSARGRYAYMLQKYPGLGFDARALLGATRASLREGQRDKAETYYSRLQSEFSSSEQAREARDEFKELRAP